MQKALLLLFAFLGENLCHASSSSLNTTTTGSESPHNVTLPTRYEPPPHLAATLSPNNTTAATNDTESFVASVSSTSFLTSSNDNQAPQWMVDFIAFRKRLFLRTVEPIIVMLLGPGEPTYNYSSTTTITTYTDNNPQTQQALLLHLQQHEALLGQSRYIPSYEYLVDEHEYDENQHHRRLGFLPNYVEDVNAFKETSMSFATLVMLFALLSCVFLIFLSCFYHNQKTSPLFSSPRRHRLPKLVPPPLPVDGYFKWMKVCFLLSDEEIIHRIGYDALIFLRFHRLALRCIVKMSVFSCGVLLPLNFTGGGHANAKDLKGYVGSLFFTDFLRFTMANVSGGSPRLWVHCFAAYLLTAIVCRELLIEYENFNSIRHQYLLSREPHLRTVLVTNIPRHLRARNKINSYFRHVYPQAVQQVVLCQNVLTLEQLVRQRTSVLSQLEKELLLLCRTEKYKLFQQPPLILNSSHGSQESSTASSTTNVLYHKCAYSCGFCCRGLSNPAASWTLALQHVLGIRRCLEKLQLVPGTQERLTRLYTLLESLNQDIEAEQRRRRRVMKMLDRMEAGGGSKDIDYLLALSSPYNNERTSTASTSGGGSAYTSRTREEQEAIQRNSKRLGLVVPKNQLHPQLQSQHALSPTPENATKHPNVHPATTSTGPAGVVGPPPPPPPPPPPVADQYSQKQEQQQDVMMPKSNNNDSGLRARSPIQAAAMNNNTGIYPDADDATMATMETRDSEHHSKSHKSSSKSSSAMSKARMKMQKFSRKAKATLTPNGSTSFNQQSNAIAVATAEAAADVYVPAPSEPEEYSASMNAATGVGGTTVNDGNARQPAHSYHESSSSSKNAYNDLLHQGRDTAPPNAHLEDHLNEVSDKAFVVMQTFTAATIAIQSMHSSRPGSMQVTTAPEPRDILWDNIYVSKGATRTRSYIGEVVVLLIITFYVVPIALVSLLVSESALVSSSPRLEQLDQASAFFSSAIAMVQPMCIVGIQQLLPPLFMAIGRVEGLVSFSEVQMRAFSRYFLFQVVNVFLVTTIAGSIFDTIAIIVENPEAAFEMLGNSLPRMSSFFITFVTIKTFLGLGLELVRTMSIVQATLRYLLFPNATLRTQRTVLMGMRAIDDPGWFPFHKILAQDMLVVVISVVFAVVAPLVLLPCALFCTFSRIMWTHHHLYVYESVFESGGQFWPKIFRRFVFGLIIAQMTITGQFILKEARHEAYATIALMFMTYLFLRSTRARYDPTSSTLPLEVATVMDIRLHQEQQQAVAAAAAQSAHAAEGPSKAPHIHARNEPLDEPGSSVPPLPELGTRIGAYDPFENAYIQPALRANPRARPEQPFPPAQLGREDLSTGGLGDGGPQVSSFVLDSGARVRLKGLHQRDRRNLNNWWNEQFKKCGDQNILRILIGEECGTLTITEHEYTAPSPVMVRKVAGQPSTHEIV